MRTEIHTQGVSKGFNKHLEEVDNIDKNRFHIRDCIPNHLMQS